MNKNKRILTLALCLIYMFSAAVFAAAEDISPEAPTIDVKVVNGVAGAVEISGIAPSGQAGDVVTLLVTNLAAEAEDNDIEDVVAALATRVQYQDTVITGEEGRFSKIFMINMDTAITNIADGSVEFNFYAGGEGFEGSQVATGYLWYAPFAAKLDAAKEVIAKINEDTETSLKEAGVILKSYEKVFAIESPLFSSLDMTELATLFATKIDGVEFLEDTPENQKTNEAEYDEFEAALRLSIALEGFNQNKQDIVINGTTILNDDILKLTDYIKSKGTLGKIYTKDITAEGVTDALYGIFGMDVNTAEELQKLLAKQVLVYGIKANKDSGSGVVETVLTKDNLAAADYDVEAESTAEVKTLKTEYLDKDNKALINDDIYQKRSSITAANLKEEIIKSATKEYTVDNEDNDDYVKPAPSTNKGSISVGVSAAPQVQEKFSDLAGYDWAKTAIITLAEKNIINGVAAQQFNPAGTLTREAAAKIICLAVGISPSAEKTAFADVDANAWHAPYIAALSKAGIINGVSDTAFGVGYNVTREDFAVMICRALNFTASNNNSFKDKDSISAYALDAVSALYERGIVGGYEDGSFKPKANISRAEGAKIIYGILSK